MSVYNWTVVCEETHTHRHAHARPYTRLQFVIPLLVRVEVELHCRFTSPGASCSSSQMRFCVQAISPSTPPSCPVHISSLGRLQHYQLHHFLYLRAHFPSLFFYVPTHRLQTPSHLNNKEVILSCRITIKSCLLFQRDYRLIYSGWYYLLFCSFCS